MLYLPPQLGPLFERGLRGFEGLAGRFHVDCNGSVCAAVRAEVQAAIQHSAAPEQAGLSQPAAFAHRSVAKHPRNHLDTHLAKVGRPSERRPRRG